MQKFIAWIQAVLIPTLGPFGLFLVAFVDSSFFSIPEINDILVITAAMNNPKTAWISVLMATLGSLAGCLVLYWVGLRGEETLLVKRFGEEKAQARAGDVRALRGAGPGRARDVAAAHALQDLRDRRGGLRAVRCASS